MERKPCWVSVDRHYSVIDLITWSVRRKPLQSHEHTETDTQNALQLYLLVLADDGLRLDLLFEPKTHLFLLKSPFPLMSRFHGDTQDTPLKMLSLSTSPHVRGKYLLFYTYSSHVTWTDFTPKLQFCSVHVSHAHNLDHTCEIQRWPASPMDQNFTSSVFLWLGKSHIHL